MTLQLLGANKKNSDEKKKREVGRGEERETTITTTDGLAPTAASGLFGIHPPFCFVIVVWVRWKKQRGIKDI